MDRAAALAITLTRVGWWLGVNHGVPPAATNTSTERIMKLRDRYRYGDHLLCLKSCQRRQSSKRADLR